MKRRTIFATPFVVVVGCGRPAERPVPATPAFWSPQELIDSAVADAAPCTPPGPVTCERDCAAVNTDGGTFDAPVTSVASYAGALTFTFLQPAGSGPLDPRSSGYFVDEHGAEISGTRFDIDPVAQGARGVLDNTCSLPAAHVHVLPYRERKPRPRQIISNPPHPNAPAHTPVEGRILQIEVVRNELLLVVGVGTNEGVDRTWKGVVVTDAGPTTVACSIVRTDARMTVCKITATNPRAPSRVRFDPPKP